MSIIKTHHGNVSISCDCCDETFVETHGLINPIDEDDHGQSSFANEEDAEDYARRNGWVKDGEKHYCEECKESLVIEINDFQVKDGQPIDWDGIGEFIMDEINKIETDKS